MILYIYWAGSRLKRVYSRSECDKKGRGLLIWVSYPIQRAREWERKWCANAACWYLLRVSLGGGYPKDGTDEYLIESRWVTLNRFSNSDYTNNNIFFILSCKLCTIQLENSVEIRIQQRSTEQIKTLGCTGESKKSPAQVAHTCVIIQ